MSKASSYNLFIALMLICSFLISSLEGKMFTLLLGGQELSPWLSPANNLSMDFMGSSLWSD